MIASRLPAFVIHPLLDHGPFAVIRDDEAVEIEIEPVLDRRTVDLRHEAAGIRKRRAVEADSLADSDEFMRRLPRVASPPAADMNAELLRERSQPALQGPDDAGGDAGGMP